ncbi:nuclear transport factor 2 family protein [Oleomonas cavernae]|uniref:Nuclear transport factor 2 family protein n=1 Tax=Oleomonas cavernae TaxID=2320859 RepID=A0A418WGM9_9PROT|nr:nuclear transport factor 2 family protein [Oleomonas cavernae]RJF89175.1 nuclear transport factor 2 family protein [Oleomonas cavernae]
MYHFILRRKLRTVFSRLNAGDYPFITRQFHPQAEHWFAGDHAMSGRRVTHARIEEWYRRLAAVFPGIKFDIKKLFVSGPPWRSHAAVEWTDTIFDREGRPLPNQGAFVITIRWGRVTAFHVYCDTVRIEKSLGILAAQGVAAAAATPITG